MANYKMNNDQLLDRNNRLLGKFYNNQILDANNRTIL